MHLCTFRSIPADRECLEACWSNGRACKSCYRDDCYRQGWTQQRVTVDNLRLVKEKIRSLDK
jgi:hypothetical protein